MKKLKTAASVIAFILTVASVLLADDQLRSASEQLKLSASQVQFAVDKFAPGYDTIVAPSSGTTSQQDTAIGGTLSLATRSEIDSNSDLVLSVCVLTGYKTKGKDKKKMETPRCWPHVATTGLGGWTASPVQVGAPNSGCIPTFYLLRLNVVPVSETLSMLAETSYKKTPAEQNIGAAEVAAYLRRKGSKVETAIVRSASAPTTTTTSTALPAMNSTTSTVPSMDVSSTKKIAVCTTGG